MAAFQCRNPIHRAHYELFTRALDAENVGEGAVCLVHPTMGPTQVGRCTLKSVDPQLESDWFQTLTLEKSAKQSAEAILDTSLTTSQAYISILVSKRALQMQPAPLHFGR